MNRPKPALRVEFLFYLTFLAAFAILVGVATSLFALAVAPDPWRGPRRGLRGARGGHLRALYGRSLVTRLVLRPLGRVMETGDAVADSVKYTSNLGTAYNTTSGVVGPTITVTADGFTATVSHTTTTKTCAIYVGSTALAPANKEGEPKCA